MNTKGKKEDSYIKDRQKERIGERAKKEYDSTTPTPLSTYTCAYTQIRDLSRSSPLLIRVKIDFFPLP